MIEIRYEEAELKLPEDIDLKAAVLSIIREKQDLTYLNWSKIRKSPGGAGSFLKATSDLGGSRSIINSQTMTTSGA